MKPRPEAGEAGFTLLELLISLGLFALIAVAGLTLVEGVIKVQERTDGRFDRLADLQRALFVIGLDVDQIADGNVSGGGENLSFTRSAPAIGGAALNLHYSLANGNVVRQVGPELQGVLSNVQSIRWRFWDGVWRDRWPVDEASVGDWPRAIAVDMQVIGPGGAPTTMRRVITLPTRAEQGE